MTRVLYTAFDIVPSPKGASTHILHNLRGLAAAGFEVRLLTPNDGLLPTEETLEGASLIRVRQDLSQNFLSRAISFGRSVMAHVAAAPHYNVVQFRSVWD